MMCVCTCMLFNLLMSDCVKYIKNDSDLVSMEATVQIELMHNLRLSYQMKQENKANIPPQCNIPYRKDRNTENVRLFSTLFIQFA
mmetsp:Transcript_13515/g.18122  ORF Transcript_13515/g.18122 Transcript_13515/m.18122 type:complete len:85 (+) Transcript_13515:1331-1585(+)